MPVITSLPYTISSPGLYTLGVSTYDPSPNGISIMINSDDVTIDGCGNIILGSAGSNTVSTGIYASGRKNITIKNIKIRGYLYDVRLNDDTQGYVNGGHLIDNVDVDGYFFGIMCCGQKSVVRNCKVVKIGGSTVWPTALTCGIATYGAGCSVEYNKILDVMPVGATESVGISLSNGGASSRVKGNFIANPTVSNIGYGIWIGDNAKAIVSDNEVINFNSVLAFSSGTSGIYSNNISAGCPGGYVVSSQDVVDGGGNL